ncbi:hypothetical protein CROQUDRAFT_563292 [Cronartium quercuum f. sp. fusiforme G11]|uniref:Uncharacterized protein n=1 Tax=Cronartium quercuum f. sp. fusiforme G11 TaxID=708437 RepID=A0A9P6NJX5_9BASI|nr:hypothetical protein CROQUDRAFT_563292 [Cronartium quercuum f. sp. fusiforme G11]
MFKSKCNTIEAGGGLRKTLNRAVGQGENLALPCICNALESFILGEKNHHSFLNPSTMFLFSKKENSVLENSQSFITLLSILLIALSSAPFTHAFGFQNALEVKEADGKNIKRVFDKQTTDMTFEKVVQTVFTSKTNEGHMGIKLVGQVTGRVTDNVKDHVTDHVTDNVKDHVTDNVKDHVTDNVKDHVTDNVKEEKTWNYNAELILDQKTHKIIHMTSTLK